MAEQMLIVDPQGREIGSVVVETPEHQAEIDRLLRAQGYRLEEPLPPPPDLERGGDLEADDCRDDLPEGEVDNCALAVSVSYIWDFCSRHDIPVPQLQRIVDSKRIEDSGTARAAVEEAVRAVNAHASRLTAGQHDEVRKYIVYGFPDLAAGLPAVVPARAAAEG